jgi:hypothetical protein
MVILNSLSLVLGYISYLVLSESDLNGLFESRLIEEITRVASKEDHAGAKGESSRLLCYLILTCLKYKKFEVIHQYLKFDSFQMVVEQLGCEHIVMVNEALLSLSVCTTVAYG